MEETRPGGVEETGPGGVEETGKERKGKESDWKRVKIG